MTERLTEPTPQIEVYTVIEVTFRRGKGTPEDIVRMVRAFYKDDGEFLFEIDPMAPSGVLLRDVPHREPSRLTTTRLPGIGAETTA